jgi:hypothetical protein
MQTNTKQDKRQLCKYCGSVLDSDGKHTDEWKRSWNGSSVRHRARLYRVWTGMRYRCHNPRNACYDSYGGRGITICPEWDDYSAFREWALSHGYKLGLQLDRIDNDDGYYPGNCRLCTRSEQMQNRRLPSRHKTGKRYNNCCITPDDIYEIRASDKSQSELGRIYDVHSTTIRNIKLRKSWGDLPECAPVLH